MQRYISVVGASEHNLKNISVNIPRNKFVVITGVSGSGKSSLAFNTIYAEGQRRYVESLSTYARQFIGQMDKPAVDSIEGLSPAIAIEQKTIGRNPRSTVGTITEIYDYYRLLYARIGVPYDPDTGQPMSKQTIDEITDIVMEHSEGTKLIIFAPVVQNKKGTHKKLLTDATKLGFTRARINGTMQLLEKDIVLEKTYKHTVEIVTGRIIIGSESQKRVTESLERALELTDGYVICNFEYEDEISERNFSLKYAYQNRAIAMPALEPQLFSFNSPVGSCPHCSGLGYTMELDKDLVIPDMKLSYYERGIAPFSENWNWYDANIKSLAKHLGADLHDAFELWPDDAMRQLLYGSDEPIKVTYHAKSGHTREFNRRFPGIMVDLFRRYQTTTAHEFREWLERFMRRQTCSECGGGRLCLPALHVKVSDIPIHRLTALSVNESVAFFDTIRVSERDTQIATEILKEISARLHFLKEVGLGYLSLDRYAGTLSGGESQRIRLASHIGSALVGVLYVLDEPTIGLHQRDNERLLNMLIRLRDLGNTILVVEHDEQAIRMADYIIDVGPYAGKHGGEIVAVGTCAQVSRVKNSLTARYLAGNLLAEIPSVRRTGNGTMLSIRNIKEHNLKDIDVHIPLGCFCVITGVSGSGKSTVLQDIVYPGVYNRIHAIRSKSDTQNTNMRNTSTHNHSRVSRIIEGDFSTIDGVSEIDKIIDIDQSPIGRTPRSNPGTYVKVFDHIRELFSQLPESKARGYKLGRFSFNVSGGRCEACLGAGVQTIEMHFLSDVYVTCDICKGHRFNRETLEIMYKGKTIHDILAMTIDEAAEFFTNIPPIMRKLQILQQVGMGYITIGQSAVTLSGGEAQRIKLALELSKMSTGKTLYLLDEPTTGLHQYDILNLLHVLHELVERGNTILLIEHNLEIIAQADFIIDLGPEGGDAGGTVVATGTPETIMKKKKSYTGQVLVEYMRNRT